MRLNVYNTIRNFDARQTGASQKGICPDAGEFTVFLEGDARQAEAAIEGPRPDADNTFRDCNARQTSAASEGTMLDTSDTVRDRYAC